MASSIWSCVKEVIFLQDLCGIQYVVMCTFSDMSTFDLIHHFFYVTFIMSHSKKIQSNVSFVLQAIDSQTVCLA